MEASERRDQDGLPAPPGHWEPVRGPVTPVGAGGGVALALLHSARRFSAFPTKIRAPQPTANLRFYQYLRSDKNDGGNFLYFLQFCAPTGGGAPSEAAGRSGSAPYAAACRRNKSNPTDPPPLPPKRRQRGGRRTRAAAFPAAPLRKNSPSYIKTSTLSTWITAASPDSG